MINAYITGSRNEIEWTKRRMMNSPKIRLVSISEARPLKRSEGLYSLRVRFRRADVKKSRNAKLKLNREESRMVRLYSRGRN